MTYLEELQHAIKDVHGVDSRHLQSVPYREVFRGQLVWDGTVEVFEAIGHPHATRVYAWGYRPKSSSSRQQVVAVLGLPPVDSVATAVKVGVAGLIKMQKA
jgi:hypothetical protein